MLLKKSFAYFFTTLILLSAGCGSEKNDNTTNSAQKTAELKIITKKSELIGGPNALGDIGDYLLKNDKIRVIVQRPGLSRGMGVYGGGIIDADIIRPEDEEGKDNFGEMMPAFLLMSILPDHMEIIDDGKESGTAHLRVHGTPGDVVSIIDKYMPLIMDHDQVEFQVDYLLESGKQYVEVHTTVINKSDEELDLSMSLVNALAGSFIKGLKLQLPLPAGDVLLFGAGNVVFMPGVAGFDVQYAIDREYFKPLALPALPGLVTDFIATAGPEVSYGIWVKPNERNYALMNHDYYKNATDHSLEVPFLMDGLTGAYHTWLPESLEAHKSYTIVKYFAVGNGDVGSIRDLYQDFFGQKTGTLSGTVYSGDTLEPKALASVVVFDEDGLPFSQYTADKNGNFKGRLPAGKYTMRVVSETAPSTSKAEAVPVTISEGKESKVELSIGLPARLMVEIKNENNEPMPAKITLVGQYDETHLGLEPMEFLYDYSIGEKRRPNDLSHVLNDGYSNREFIEKMFNTNDGFLDADVRPGNYTVVVSRGPEYSQERRTVTLTAGGESEISVTLKRVVDTSGYSSGDLHIHSVNSLDSFTSLDERVKAIAGEGMDFAVATDHNYITDYGPTADKLALNDWVKPIVGVEYTCLEMGHFNGWPLRYDPDSPVHGKSPWVPEPAEDAPKADWDKYNALPDYLKKPQRIAGFPEPSGFEWFYMNPLELLEEVRSLGKYGPEGTVVIVNHPRDTFMGYFNAYNLDTETGMPRPAANQYLNRESVSTGQYKCSNFSFDFDGIEVLNGMRLDLLHAAKMPLDAESDEYAHLPEGNGPGKYLVEANGQRAYPGGVDDWFNLLNQGYRYTAVGASDSHQILEDQVGLNRTYMRVGEKLVRALDERDLVSAVKEHRAIVSNGPFINMEIDSDERGNGNGEVALIGDELKAENGQVLVKVTLQSAHWIKVDRLVLWVNGEVVKEWTKADGLPGELSNGRYLLELTHNLSLDKDSWVVLEAYGDDEGRNSLWPVYTFKELPATNILNVVKDLADSMDVSLNKWGRFKPSYVQRVYPYALTNPIWIDVGGDGEFTPPAPKEEPCKPWSAK